MDLWDFVSRRGENVVRRWADDDGLSKRDRALLNQKLDRLQQIDFELAIGTRMLGGPLCSEIYKVIVHGDVMLRPMLCRGPVNRLAEYTLLCGAVEKGGKLPKGILDRAAGHHQELVDDPQRRCGHERF